MLLCEVSFAMKYEYRIMTDRGLDSCSPLSRRDKFRGNDGWSAGYAGEYLNRLLGSNVL